MGFGLTTLTLLFGWLAFNTVDHADDAHEPMIVHATLALLTASGFALLTLWSFWHRKTAGRYPSWLFVGSLLIFFALLLVTALRGGELVYRYGLAVNSPAVPASNTPLPERGDANAPEHHHDHHHHNHDKSQAQ